jgi:hypothetical protein
VAEWGGMNSHRLAVAALSLPLSFAPVASCLGGPRFEPGPTTEPPGGDPGPAGDAGDAGDGGDAGDAGRPGDAGDAGNGGDAIPDQAAAPGADAGQATGVGGAPAGRTHEARAEKPRRPLGSGSTFSRGGRPLHPRAASPEVGVLVVTQEGALCLLDGATGALRWRREGRASDVRVSRTAPGEIVVLEPSDGSAEGQLVRYQVDAAGAELIGALEFPGEAGRLLDVGELTVGVSFAEAATLFVASEGGGPGKAWAAPMAAAVLGGHAVRALDWAGALWSAEATAAGVVSGGPAPAVLPDGSKAAALAELGGELAVVAVEGGLLSLRADAGGLLAAGDHPLSPGAWVDEALGGGALGGEAPGGGVWTLLGPTPELRRLGAGHGDGPLVLPGELSEAPWVGHRLSSVGARSWVALGARVVAVSAREGLPGDGALGLVIDEGFSAACVGDVSAALEL